MGIGHVVITVMSGAYDGKVFDLDTTPIMLGRHPDDDGYLRYDNRVSRHHARIAREGTSYFIEDVGPDGKGSGNGTYINDRRISGKTPISSGQMVLLGSVWIRFEAK
jgi:pSer/pThr/pTyr-binding forkhead associated (FHA) protein